LKSKAIPRREIGALLEAGRSAFHPSRILGISPVMVDLRRAVALAARTGQNVLLRGEPGAGKEFVARTLHFSGRRSGAFVPVNCAALASDLLASELFGHVKGSSEGAVSDRPGLLHQAHLGTLLLDEVDSIPMVEQAKLVRALVDGEVLRVGATRAEHVDVRVIATTSATLERLVEEGSFDPALLAVISEVALVVPTLRARKSDVMHLAPALPRGPGLGARGAQLLAGRGRGHGALQLAGQRARARELRRARRGPLLGEHAGGRAPAAGLCATSPGEDLGVLQIPAAVAAGPLRPGDPLGPDDEPLPVGRERAPGRDPAAARSGDQPAELREGVHPGGPWSRRAATSRRPRACSRSERAPSIESSRRTA
jgi:hypothetical protein